MEVRLRESPDSKRQQNREKYWKILVGFNWLVLLVVYIDVFIVRWEGPGRDSSMGNGINLLIGEGIIFSSTLLTALLLCALSAPVKYHLLNLAPVAIGILTWLALLLLYR